MNYFAVTEAVSKQCKITFIGKPATMPPSKRGLGGSLFTSSVMPTSRFDKDVTVDDIMEDRDDVRKREAIKRTEPSMFASSFVRPGVTQIAKPMSPMRRTVFQDRKAPSPGKAEYNFIKQ